MSHIRRVADHQIELIAVLRWRICFCKVTYHNFGAMITPKQSSRRAVVRIKLISARYRDFVIGKHAQQSRIKSACTQCRIQKTDRLVRGKELFCLLKDRDSCLASIFGVCPG